MKISIIKHIWEFDKLALALQDTDIITNMARNSITFKMPYDANNYYNIEQYYQNDVFSFLFENCSGLWAVSTGSDMSLHFEKEVDMVMTKLRFENVEIPGS